MMPQPSPPALDPGKLEPPSFFSPASPKVTGLSTGVCLASPVIQAFIGTPLAVLTAPERTPPSLLPRLAPPPIMRFYFFRTPPWKVPAFFLTRLNSKVITRFPPLPPLRHIFASRLSCSKAFSRIPFFFFPPLPLKPLTLLILIFLVPRTERQTPLDAQKPGSPPPLPPPPPPGEPSRPTVFRTRPCVRLVPGKPRDS